MGPAPAYGQHIPGPPAVRYQSHLGVEDVIVLVLNRLHTHLNEQASSARIMFFDLSSAFDAIRPALLDEKLQVGTPLVLDY